MRRLSSQETERISALVNEGKSLKKIAKILGKGKTTVYYHFRKIKGTTMKPVVLNLQNDEHVGEFIGLFAGDGTAQVDKNNIYRVIFCLHRKELAFVQELTEQVLFPMFGKRPGIRIRGNRLFASYSSKEIFKVVHQYLDWDRTRFRTYSVHLKSVTHSLQFMRGFLRGCLDSDGYVAPTKIVFASVSYPLISNMVLFLNHLGIRHSVYSYKEHRGNRVTMYHIYVRKASQMALLREINPRNKKRDASAGN